MSLVPGLGSMCAPLIVGVMVSLVAVFGAASAEDGAPEIVARHTALFRQPPRAVPTEKTPDGPLLGNGDVGVVLAGPSETQAFYIGKNDFWSRKCIITVGGVALDIPELSGASYRQEQNLFNAEVRGTFAKEGLSVRMRSWVCASENLLVTQLAAEGPKPVGVALTLWAGPRAAASGTRAIQENNNRVNLGREQHGGGRWFFDGMLDEVRIFDRALSPDEIKALCDLKDVPEGLLRYWGFDEDDGDAAKDSSGKGGDGKIIGGGREAGHKGKALKLDGKKSYVDCPPVRVGSAVTVSAFIYPIARAKEGEAQYIFSKGEWNQAYSLGLSGGKLRFAVGNDFAQTDKPLPLNRWSHVAGTSDGRRIRIFVDGAEAAQKAQGADLPVTRGQSDAALWFTRSGAPDGAEWRKVAVASRVLGAQLQVAADGDDAAVSGSFQLAPGAAVTVVSAILSDRDTADFLNAARKRVAELTPDTVEKLQLGHRQWWKEFWARSFIEVPDKVIEQHYYGALYILGSCNRPGKIAPGLFGNWITTDRPAWQGDYTLNYNFEAPFYGVDVANHGELALPYFDAITGLLPQGREMAAKRNWKGVHFPTHFGPYGLLTEGWQDWGQRSDAAYAALPFIDHCVYSQDAEFLKQKAYPFLLEVAAFWEDYLKFENGRYMIYNDSIHEGSGTDVNPVLTLGLVRRLFSALMEFSKELGIDEARHEKWRHILDNLAAYPLQEREGKTVFRYTEKGTPWWGDNGLGIQHIYPAGAIGLDSDPKLLEISRNMVAAMGRWTDGNCFSSFYPAAARVAYSPETILKNLRGQCEKHAFPNLHFVYGGGGIENCSGVIVTVQEMLLQSHQGVLRLFPCWPKDQAARFGHLRAAGAFLVSSEFKDGKVQSVLIESEKGGNCTLLNPWPGGRALVLEVDGTARKPVTVEPGADRFTFKTRPGGRYAVQVAP